MENFEEKVLAQLEVMHQDILSIKNTLEPSPEPLSMKETAKRLGVSYNHFRTVLRHQDGFPKPIDSAGRPTWEPVVIENYLAAYKKQ